MKTIVIIPARGKGDSDEFLEKTLEHMYYPRPRSEHVVMIVDDNPTPTIDQGKLVSQYPDIHVIHTGGDVGCAESRDMGVERSPVEIADDDILVFLDAHMNPNLYQDASPGNFIDKIVAHIAIDSNRILCGKCFALDGSTWYAISGKTTPVAYAAELELIGPDGILEPHWIGTDPKQFPPYFKKLPSDPQAFRVPLVHGACYAMTAKVFRDLEGFSGLEEWGSDEVYMCLKAYIANPRLHMCGVMEDVRVGHLFNPTGPHPERAESMVVNKYRLVKELFPSHLVEPYIQLIRMKEPGGKKAYERYLTLIPELEKKRRHWMDKFSPKRMEAWLRAFERDFHSKRMEINTKANPFLRKFSGAVHTPKKMQSLFASTTQFKTEKLAATAASDKPVNTKPMDGLWP